MGKKKSGAPGYSTATQSSYLQIERRAGKRQGGKKKKKKKDLVGLYSYLSY